MVMPDFRVGPGHKAEIPQHSCSALLVLMAPLFEKLRFISNLFRAVKRPEKHVGKWQQLVWFLSHNN